MRFTPLVFLSLITLPAFAQPRIAVLSEKDFPSVDGISISEREIKNGLDGYQVRLLSASALRTELNRERFDLVITPYGSAFPKDLASTLFQYLRNGGAWINLGGTPFSVPVVSEAKKWKKEIPQTAYHKKIGITQSFPVSGATVESYQATPGNYGGGELSREFSAEEIYELYVRFTSTKDFPDEDGTAGQRDAKLTPLVHGINTAKVPLAAPFLVIDRIQGEFAGGRWVLANYKGSLTAKGLRILVDIAMELGCDGVLMNTAIAKATQPVRMARAMRDAVRAGRNAYLAGRMPRRFAASPSSPMAGLMT